MSTMAPDPTSSTANTQLPPANPPARAKPTLGQWLGLALLGLSVYEAQDQNGGPSMFENPATVSVILGDVAKLFPNL